MTWFLIVLLSTNVVIEQVSSKLVCEELRTAIMANYGKGSPLSNVLCLSVDGGSKK